MSTHAAIKVPVPEPLLCGSREAASGVCPKIVFLKTKVSFQRVTGQYAYACVCDMKFRGQALRFSAGFGACKVLKRRILRNFVGGQYKNYTEAQLSI